MNYVININNKISVAGFNRYMVECELKDAVKQRTVKSGFNRYMVECEFKYCAKNSGCVVVLIDTWWNVNSSDTSR